MRKTVGSDRYRKRRTLSAMESSYVIEKPPGCVIITIAGHPTFASVKGLMQSFSEDPRFEAGLNRLYDLRRAESFLSNVEMRSLAQYVMDSEEVYGERKTVVLVGNDLFFGLSRMLLTYIEGSKARFSVTKSPSGAKDSVGLAADYGLPADL